jgi:hypothetical protein
MPSAHRLEDREDARATVSLNTDGSWGRRRRTEHACTSAGGSRQELKNTWPPADAAHDHVEGRGLARAVRAEEATIRRVHSLSRLRTVLLP